MFNSGTMAINWVKPSENPVFKPGYAGFDSDFQTQTSVIRTWRNNQQHTLHVVIEHNQKPLQIVFTEEQVYSAGIDYLLDIMAIEIENRYGIDDSKVPLRLVRMHLGEESSQKYLPDMAEYSYGTHSFSAVGIAPSPNFASISKSLPGVNEVVKHPLVTGEWMLADIIMNLNDVYRWPREKIADWIETLDIDTTFRTE
jgi:hypothetical protein